MNPPPVYWSPSKRILYYHWDLYGIDAEQYRFHGAPEYSYWSVEEQDWSDVAELPEDAVELHAPGEGVHDAIESVVNAWESYTEAPTPFMQAYAIPGVQDAISDLKSWHPRFDYETGVIKPEQETCPSCGSPEPEVSPPGGSCPDEFHRPGPDLFERLERGLQ